MTFGASIRRFAWLAGLIACGACSSSDQPGGSGSAAGPGEVREIPAAKLPALGDAAPTSDPAVEAAGPSSWKRLPRKDEQYLIGWYGASSPNVLPRIFVRVADWSGQAGDTTADNVADLAAEIAKTRAAPEHQILEAPQPMSIGGVPWVRCVEEARMGNARAEKQLLERIVGGRRYLVELQIYPGKILESRDLAYAVAAGLKFQPGASAAEPSDTPAESAPAATTPADGGPADSPLPDDAAPATQP